MAKPLTRAFGESRAHDEAARLVEGLARAFVEPDSTAFLDELRLHVMRWTDMGAKGDEVSTALLALAHGAGGPRESATPTLARLVGALRIPAAFCDASGRILAANAALASRLNAPASAWIGRDLADLVVARDREVVQRLLQETPDTPVHGSIHLEGDPDHECTMSRTVFMFEPQAPSVLVLVSDPVVALTLDEPMRERLVREQRQKEEYAALLTVSQAVNHTLELNTILATVARQARMVMRTDEVTMFLYEESSQELVAAVCEAEEYAEEMMALRLKLGEGITGMVAVRRRGEIVNDVENDPRALTVPGTPPVQSSLLCVPLIAREALLGVLTMTRIGGNGFVQEDLEISTLFAGQCSAAIANARLYADARAAYDELRRTQVQLVQSAKLNALGEMAGGVAHDFNNILSAILGRTQLLLQRSADPELTSQLQVIEQAALDGANTVRRVQEFTRVRQDERFETLDVNHVLLGVLELTRPVWESGAKRRGIAIDVHLDLQSNLSIAGNASELREVFTNLVLNAVDAMPWGGDLWVSTFNLPTSVGVSVRDTGVGMNEETRTRIFDPFFTTKEIKGTGLGLSVAYGIVSRHHGSIEVESALGQGTTFLLRFPAGEADAAAWKPEQSGPLPRFRVLVVDDEEPVLQVLSDLLRALGQDVVSALGGEAGVDALSSGPFDVVFSDLGMPEVNGWDLALTVKSTMPETMVVLVTGWGFQLEEEASAARGVDLILAKPFSWEDIDRALRLAGERDGRRRVA